MASPSPGAESRAERRRLLQWSGAILLTLILLAGLAAKGAPTQMVVAGIVVVLAALGVAAWHAYALPRRRGAGKPRHPTAPEFITYRRLSTPHPGKCP